MGVRRGRPKKPKPVPFRNKFNLAICEVKGVKKNWFVMVNHFNQTLINTNFCTPMTYLGATEQDVIDFYKENNHTFSTDFKGFEMISQRIYQ